MTELFGHVPNPKHIQFSGTEKTISYKKDDMKAMTSHQLVMLKRWIEDELTKRTKGVTDVK